MQHTRLFAATQQDDERVLGREPRHSSHVASRNDAHHTQSLQSVHDSFAKLQYGQSARDTPQNSKRRISENFQAQQIKFKFINLKTKVNNNYKKKNSKHSFEFFFFFFFLPSFFFFSFFFCFARNVFKTTVFWRHGVNLFAASFLRHPMWRKAYLMWRNDFEGWRKIVSVDKFTPLEKTKWRIFVFLKGCFAKLRHFLKIAWHRKYSLVAESVTDRTKSRISCMLAGGASNKTSGASAIAHIAFVPNG
jgi:hypothetical protein